MTTEELNTALAFLKNDLVYDHSAVIDFLERFGRDAVND